MEAQDRSISWRGTPFNLSGTDVKVGDPAPDCELVANDLSLVRLSSYQGKIRIISAVPSLDTPTCDMETRKFTICYVQLRNVTFDHMKMFGAER